MFCSIPLFIESVKIATKSGILECAADFFIDASGDGELMFMSGCDYQLGRESDGLSQPMTTCFRLADVDVPLFMKQREELQVKYAEYREAQKITNPRENILFFIGLGDGMVHFNTTRVVKHNPVDPFEISRAEITARKQIHEMVDFLKENSEAFKNCTLVAVANHIGVRESRKLKGVYILTAEDIETFYDFEDSIALGNYGIDIHNPSGTGTTQFHLKDGEFYKIPYRSLLPKEYDNMLVAGRCMGVDQKMQASIRVMPGCFIAGQAAGVAAALACEKGETRSVKHSELSEKLKKLGAYLPNC